MNAERVTMLLILIPAVVGLVVIAVENADVFLRW